MASNGCNQHFNWICQLWGLVIVAFSDPEAAAKKKSSHFGGNKIVKTFRDITDCVSGNSHTHDGLQHENSSLGPKDLLQVLFS